MQRKALWIAGVAGTALLLTLATLTVAAGPGEGLVHHLHARVHAHHALVSLVADLDLDDGQQAHVAAIHELLSAHRADMAEAHGRHLAALTERLADGGAIDPSEARTQIDHHAALLRHLAYQVSDELVPLVNSLDADQRATLIEHLHHLELLRAHEEQLRTHEEGLHGHD